MGGVTKIEFAGKLLQANKTCPSAAPRLFVESGDQSVKRESRMNPSGHKL